ncbi:MAG: heme lyase CcmF/NrfE family subunit [Anaerolineales bacterium]
MVANIGYFVLVLAFLIAIYGAVSAAFGATKRRPEWVESARRAMLLTFPLISISSIALIILLVRGDFQIAYVASVTNRSMPTYLKITAWWGGQAGSLLFWSWLMAAFTTAASARKWSRDRELLPWVIVVTLVTLAFFLSLVVFFENPFQRLWVSAEGQQVTALFQPTGARPLMPVDGRGLNPLLRHPGMIIHPPMLYLGFVSFVIPYAFAMAALMAKRKDDRWIRLTRRWTLVAWLFLSLGLILGGRWAYDVLGWGGYWAWDPVETAALLPWLAGTPFLHSVMVQEKKGMFKQWNVILIILTYLLVILGTFMTRSGVVSSVHAFAQSAIGPAFFAFLGVMLLASVGLLIDRWDLLKSDNKLESMASRESFFLFNNLVFMIILAISFTGMMFPTFSEIFTGQRVTVAQEWFERNTGPFWGLLLILMGVAPLTAYGSASWKRLGTNLWKPAVASLVIPVVLYLNGVDLIAAILGYWMAGLAAFVTLYEFWRAAWARYSRHGENLLLALWNLAGRNRRRYGGYIIHLGVVLMALGIIGIELYQTETQATLARGEQLTLGRYIMTYDAINNWDHEDGDRNVLRAVVTVYRDGEQVATLYPRRDFYYSSGTPATIPAVRSTLQDDFYVLVVGSEGPDATTFKVYHNPLVNFVWLGGGVFILGTLVAAWPSSSKRRVTHSSRKRMAEARV